MIGKNVSTISYRAFGGCSKLTSVEFKNPDGWMLGSTEILADDLRNFETAATYLTSTYCYNTWTREDKGE